MAERRPLVCCATCDVTPSRRISATKSQVSNSLSAPTVTRPPLGSSPSMALAASRSAVPVAVVTVVFHHQPVPVFHQHMPHMAQLRSLPRGFAEQSRVGVGG